MMVYGNNFVIYKNSLEIDEDFHFWIEFVKGEDEEK